MDIYDELERIVPLEYKDDFLRVSRELRDYGEHNPELLRFVEVVGLTSLYTEKLPARIAQEFETAADVFEAASRTASGQIEAVIKAADKHLQTVLQSEQQLQKTVKDLEAEHRATLKTILGATDDRLRAVLEALNRLCDPTSEQLAKIDSVARRALQIQAVNLLTALALAFALGAVVTIAIQMLTAAHLT